jgi:hypothetical protein
MSLSSDPVAPSRDTRFQAVDSVAFLMSFTVPFTEKKKSWWSQDMGM